MRATSRMGRLKDGDLLGKIANGKATCDGSCFRRRCASFLRSRGCVEMQGYYFFKSMPSADFEKISDPPAGAASPDALN